jgi:hypothetical protein
MKHHPSEVIDERTDWKLSFGSDGVHTVNIDICEDFPEAFD